VSERLESLPKAIVDAMDAIASLRLHNGGPAGGQTDHP
jgi:hypothetical protein